MPWCPPEPASWQMVALRYEEDLTYRQIAERMGFLYDHTQAWRVCKFYIDHGKVPIPGTHKRPQQEDRTHLKDEAKHILWMLYVKDPSLFLDEATKMINMEVGRTYSEYAVDLAMREMGLTAKKVFNRWLLKCVSHSNPAVA